MPSGDLSEVEFVKRAINKLKEPPNEGIHSEYSGFNKAYREYFNKDPIEGLERLEKEGKVVKRPVKNGFMIYLPEDAPQETDPYQTIEKIVGDEPEENSSTSKKNQNEKGDSKKEIPLVIDKSGAHETTKFAMTSGPNRVWLKCFSEKESKIKLKSVFLSKEDVKSMDKSKTEWEWNSDSKSWLINPDNLAYVIDHFISLDYKVAISPKLSLLLIDELSLEVDYLTLNRGSKKSNYKNFSKKNNEPVKTKNNKIEYGVNPPTEKSIGDKDFVRRVEHNLRKSMSKLSPMEVIEIWERLEDGKSYESVAKDYPVGDSTINGIRTKNNWTWLTNRIQRESKEQCQGIISTINYLIIFEEEGNGIDEEVFQKILERLKFYDTKLSPFDIIDIWERLKMGDSPEYIAESYPVVIETIKGIKDGTNWGWFTDKLNSAGIRNFKRRLSLRLKEEGELPEQPEFDKYRLFDKSFINKAIRKLKTETRDYPPSSVIDIWQQLEDDESVSRISEKFDIDVKEVSEVKNNDDWAWLIRVLKNGEIEKYKGMLIALENSKLGGLKIEEESTDKNMDEGKNNQAGDSISKEVLKNVKSRYIFDDIDKNGSNLGDGGQDEGEKAGDNISPGDVVEHSLGMRGKVKKIENGTALVKVGPSDSREWKTSSCTFIRKGK